MNKENKVEYRDFLEEMTCEYCEPKRYCILKEFLVAAHPSPRLLMQLKCVDKMKFEVSKERKHDITWDTALRLWVDDGYALKFANEYNEDIKFNVLYKKVRHEEK